MVKALCAQLQQPETNNGGELRLCGSERTRMNDSDQEHRCYESNTVLSRVPGTNAL